MHALSKEIEHMYKYLFTIVNDFDH